MLVLCLLQLPHHHCLLSGRHVCSRPSHYCWFQCYHCSTSHRTVLSAASSGADDITSDMSYLSYGNSSLTATEKWLDPGPYLSVPSSITTQESNRRAAPLLSILFTYDQYIWVFLVVETPSHSECLASYFCCSSLIKKLHCPNRKLK